MTGVWVLLTALVAATGVGLLTRARDGRFRMSRARGGPRDVGARRGERHEERHEDRHEDRHEERHEERHGEQHEERHGGGEHEARRDAGAGPSTGPTAVTGAGRGGLTAELAALGHVPGEVATLLQFSTAFCAPCRVARRVLADVAAIVPGVRHVEVDAESHLELVRRLGVRRTPTVLVLDAAGVEARRASGAPPSRDAVLATLASLVEPTPDGRAERTPDGRADA
ncbi:thioredoxin family protein [Parafrankia discariae]|uniref:thioredoxin family protein n=1 Tax=Parafrankia discariae TaxID=365528 RepID=UPI000475D433|nr:thioredoxin family protein [Parafrankia discariae]